MAVVRPLEQHIEEIGQLVRELYCQAIRRHSANKLYGARPMAAWDGGIDGMGRKHTSVWPRIAKLLTGLSADPFAYVASQFQAFQAGKPPAPNQLLSQQAVDRWRLYAQQADIGVAQQLARDIEAVQAHAAPYLGSGRSEADAVRIALGNSTTNGASPLYRYCLSLRLGMRDVADFFYRAALLQYLCRQAAYDAAWVEFVPLELKAAADQLRQQPALL